MLPASSHSTGKVAQHFNPEVLSFPRIEESEMFLGFVVCSFAQLAGGQEYYPLLAWVDMSRMSPEDSGCNKCNDWRPRSRYEPSSCNIHLSLEVVLIFACNSRV